MSTHSYLHLPLPQGLKVNSSTFLISSLCLSEKLPVKSYITTGNEGGELRAKYWGELQADMFNVQTGDQVLDTHTHTHANLQIII